MRMSRCVRGSCALEARCSARCSRSNRRTRVRQPRVDFDHVAALVRRWIEGQTFQPLTGESGVHVVDAVSARYGTFDDVQLAGLVDGEWPERPRRNIFYTAAVLRDLGLAVGNGPLEGARRRSSICSRLPRND
jgi:hypothetical protein